MTDSTNQMVEHFFRHESANLVAVLTRAFGVGRIELIEDMVQVAMLEAMQAWRQRGVPQKPAAWIHRAARNRILDALRREKTHEKAVDASGRSLPVEASFVDQWLEQEHLPDSLLRMMFVCCHPTLERKTQIALTLKTLCGFGNAEIARGLLLPIETVRKRIQRARASLADAGVTPELPQRDDLSRRREVVHDVLYLMFNEGYSTSHGTAPIRDDVCEEAARLCHILCVSDCSSPSTRALLALQLFHAARLDSRTDDQGVVILLEDQDRSLWDRRLICCGQDWLRRSKTTQPGKFHLEAAIAMHHCVAPSVDSTDWQSIVGLYDQLLRSQDSPIYLLNQAIAIAQTGDTLTSLQRLTRLRDRGELTDYLLLDCAFARVHELDGDYARAIDCYLTALSKVNAPHEKKLIEKKLHACSAR